LDIRGPRPARRWWCASADGPDHQRGRALWQGRSKRPSSSATTASS